VYIPIANLQECYRLFYTVSAQPTIYDMFSIVAPIDSHHSILYLIIALVLFLKLEEKSRIIWGIFLGPNAPKLTQISFIFIPKNPRKALEILGNLPKSFGPQILLESIVQILDLNSNYPWFGF
jgi:hypothetical protein